LRRAEAERRARSSGKMHEKGAGRKKEKRIPFPLLSMLCSATKGEEHLQVKSFREKWQTMID